MVVRLPPSLPLLFDSCGQVTPPPPPRRLFSQMVAPVELGKTSAHCVSSLHSFVAFFYQCRLITLGKYYISSQNVFVSSVDFLRHCLCLLTSRAFPSHPGGCGRRRVWLPPLLSLLRLQSREGSSNLKDHHLLLLRESAQMGEGGL